MNELALFAGVGGGILGSKLLSHRIIGYVENNEYCQKVIRQRIDDGILDEAPIFGDIRAFNREGYAESYKGMVDVVSGGFPCQDISCAGKGAGLNGHRSGLWSEMRDTVRTIRPKIAFVENSPTLLVRGFGTVAGDMAAMGYDCRWGVFSGKSIGSPIERKRVFIAFTDRQYGEKRVGDINKRAEKILTEAHRECVPLWVQAPPIDFGVGDGVADYMGRVQAIGNGQVPIVAATAFRILGAKLSEMNEAI